MIRRTAALAAVLVLAGLGAACGDGDGDGDGDSARPGPTASTAVSVATTAAATTAPPTSVATTTARVTTTTRPSAATAVIEPETVAGIGLGANKSAVIAVLGNPSTMGQNTDLSGATYDFLRWTLDGNRALTLNFRTPSATSPLLTDWIATGPGPATRLGIEVGDLANQVAATYGPLQPFCCDTRIANVERGGGRLIVIVDNATGLVRQLIGGDPAFWSRSIAS